MELPTSFLKVKFVTARDDVRYDSGSHAYYLAESVLPFRTSPVAVLAGITDSHLCHLRPVQVLYYAIHRIFPYQSSSPVTTVLARVLCPQNHPFRSSKGKPVEIWCSGLHESYAFIPLENINTQLLTSETTVSHECVLITVPVII